MKMIILGSIFTTYEVSNIFEALNYGGSKNKFKSKIKRPNQVKA